METWHSPRYWEEQRRIETAKIFDDFMELVFDNTITLDQAILGIKEVIATEAEIGTVA